MSKHRISKLLAGVAYIAQNSRKNNLYNILKVFYVADKLHMERYGRFIFNEAYSAMEKGPVPSTTYDLLKTIRSGSDLPYNLLTTLSYDDQHRIEVIEPVDFEDFSESDLQCIDEVIRLSETEDLGDISHDDAWKGTERNRMMNTEAIIGTLEDAQLLRNLASSRH